MENISKNGISAITAATLIATRPVSKSTLRNMESSKKDKSETGSSLCELIDNEKRARLDDENLSNIPPYTVTSHSESKDRNTSYRNQAGGELQHYANESIINMVSVITSVYATVLICIYIAFSFTELVTFPVMYQWIVRHGFFIYLYVISNLYLMYLLCYVLKNNAKHKKKGFPKVVENVEVRNNYFQYCP